MTSRPAYLLEKIVDIPNLPCGFVHHSPCFSSTSRIFRQQTLGFPQLEGQRESRKEQEKWVARRCNLEISQTISQSFIWLMVHSLAQTSITSTNLIPSLGVAEIYPCQSTHDCRSDTGKPWLLWGQWRFRAQATVNAAEVDLWQNTGVWYTLK